MHYSLLQTSSTASSSTGSTSSRSKLLLAVGSVVLCLQGVYFLSTRSNVSSSIITPALKFHVSSGPDSPEEGKPVGTIPSDFCSPSSWDQMDNEEYTEKRGGGTVLPKEYDCASQGANGVHRDVVFLSSDWREPGHSFWWMPRELADGRVVKCAWTDGSWVDRAHMRREVCSMLRVNEGTESGKQVASQVYDAWHCKVNRVVRMNRDGTKGPMRPSIMTCVEMDVMPDNNGRAIKRSLERKPSDTAHAVELLHEALERLADATEKGVVVNTEIDFAVAEVRDHAVLYGWDHANMCRVKAMPVWLRPIAFTYMLMQWESTSHYGEFDRLGVSGQVLTEAVQSVVSTGVPTHITPRAWMSESVTRDVVVDSHAYPDLLKGYKKHVEDLTQYHHKMPQWSCNGHLHDMLEFLFQHELPQIGGFIPLSVSEAEFSITYGKMIAPYKFEHPPIVGDSFRIKFGLGYKYAEGGEAALALVNKTENDECPHVKKWLALSYRHAMRTIKFNNELTTVVEQQLENGSVKKTYKYKRIG